MRNHKVKYILVFFSTIICLSLIIGCATDTPAPIEPPPSLFQADTPAIQFTPTPQLTTGAHPSDILARLESAYNNQDIYAIARAFEPGVVDAAFAILDMFGMGGSLVELVMPLFSTALGASGVLDDGQWGTVNLTEISTQIHGNTATLTYEVQLTFSNGTVYSFTETIQTIQINGVWYISALQLPAHIEHGGTDVSDMQSEQTNVAQTTVGIDDFSIFGSWQQVEGNPGWAVVNGRTVVFNTSFESNIFSPRDIFSLSDGGSDYFWLHVTGLLGGDISYRVVVIDSNNIEVFEGRQTSITFSFRRLG